MNRSKNHYMVAHCSSCRAYRGDISIGGVILLPMILGGDIYQDAYLEKSPIFEEREQRHLVLAIQTNILDHYGLPLIQIII
jgi:hypothetical protein